MAHNLIRWLVLSGLALTLALAAALAACGGDDSTSNTSASKTQAASTTSQATTSASATAEATAGPTTTDNGGSAGHDPCKLITPDDVTKKFDSDWTVATTRSEPAGPYAVCAYGLESQSASTIAGLPAVGYLQILTREVSRDQFDQVKNAGAAGLGIEPKDISGFGESAWALGNILYVYQGGVEFNITLNGSKLVGDDEASQLQVAEDFATIVLGRLQ